MKELVDKNKALVEENEKLRAQVDDLGKKATEANETTIFTQTENRKVQEENKQLKAELATAHATIGQQVTKKKSRQRPRSPRKKRGNGDIFN